VYPLRQNGGVRILVVGGSGMLGSDLVPELRGRGHDVLAPSSSGLDITDPASVAQIPAHSFGRLDWVVNVAAYTAVDKAESEVRAATELNALGPGYLAQACASEGSRLLHVSTDFVFDGQAAEPYGEDHATNPLGVYGRSKRDGENAVLSAHSNAIIVRTSWLYGPHGGSFPRTMLLARQAGRTLRVVADQIGSPTYTGDLARVLADMIEKDAFPGIYHATGSEAMTWHAFAELILGERIEAITTDQYPTAAKRPPYSVLSNAKLAALGIEPMRPVAEALREFKSRTA
jgi:dTDP-4-dehydrorhamnose reductase